MPPLPPRCPSLLNSNIPKPCPILHTSFDPETNPSARNRWFSLYSKQSNHPRGRGGMNLKTFSRPPNGFIIKWRFKRFMSLYFISLSRAGHGKDTSTIHALGKRLRIRPNRSCCLFYCSGKISLPWAAAIRVCIIIFCLGCRPRLSPLCVEFSLLPLCTISFATMRRVVRVLFICKYTHTHTTFFAQIWRVATTLFLIFLLLFSRPLIAPFCCCPIVCCFAQKRGNRFT